MCLLYHILREILTHLRSMYVSSLLQLVVEDLCELWSLFQQKLEIRLQQRFTGGGFTTGEVRWWYPLFAVSNCK